MAQRRAVLQSLEVWGLQVSGCEGFGIRSSDPQMYGHEGSQDQRPTFDLHCARCGIVRCQCHMSGRTQENCPKGGMPRKLNLESCKNMPAPKGPRTQIIGL